MGRERDLLAAVAAGRIGAFEALGRLAAPAGPPAQATPTARSLPTVPAAHAGGRLAPRPPPPPEVALAALDGLIGLEAVKDAAREIYAMCALSSLRRSLGLEVTPAALHMVFRGPPGTGKTTVARALGQALAAMGALERGHLVEVERADLVGEYVGHTAQRTREAIHRALGGVLFIDEAYALARGGDKDFGREAIDTLVRQMEEERERLVVVLAGYPDEMDALLATNPGLASRIPIRLDFPEYTPTELVAIARDMYRRRGYALSAEAERRLPGLAVRALAAEGDSRGNARSVRNLVERSLRRHARRVLDRLARGAPLEPALLSTLEPEDIAPAHARIAPARASDASGGGGGGGR
jgi:stage V sporulation protein K